MDKPPPHAKSSKSAGTSLLQKLTRRSTKVEPAAQPPTSDQSATPSTSAAASASAHQPPAPRATPLLVGNGGVRNFAHTSGGATTTSAHSSPINQFRQSYVRRHSSTQNLSTIVRSADEASGVGGGGTPLRKPAGVIKKSKPLHNRFSHQFTLCCSFHDDRGGAQRTPPVSVRYNSLAPANGDVASDGGQSPPNSNGGGGGGTSSTDTTATTSTTVVTVHHDGGGSGGGGGDTDDGRQQSPASGSSATGGTTRNASTEPNTPAKQLTKTVSPVTMSPPMPIRNPRHNQYLKSGGGFGEFQPQATGSIAMSACRSRLRQKLLPPGGSLDLPSEGAGGGGGAAGVQHFSSPDIVLDRARRRLLAGGDGGGEDDDCDGGEADEDADEETVSALMRATEENVSKSKALSYDVLTGVRRPVSADSLAKQSLIAAQLLNLIPAERARERNFMAGRLAVNSLFGASELDKVLPAREVKIYVCTWNMNGQNPPKSMTDFVLPHSIEFVPDLVVVGTQESCSLRFEWEVSLQETLGPTHILLHSATLGTLHLAVFIRRDLIWFCSVPEDASLSVRPGTAFRTKGAVAISFSLFGTSMLFVTSHLTAHQQKVKERVQDVKRIIHSLDLPRNLNLRNKNKDVTQNFDNVFWCGDLNFRLGEPREKVLKWIENTKFPLPAHLPNGYLHTDQLKSVLSNGAAFKDFKEANITFPPTYKYDPGTQHFDTSSKQRAPAYTDRILYKRKSLPMGIRRGSNLANLLGNAASGGGGAGQLECLAYDSVPSIVTSDHKPVWALFRSPVRPGSDSVPLAAGLFNREVYLEGMKRRLNNTNADSSTVCNIQ